MASHAERLLADKNWLPPLMQTGVRFAAGAAVSQVSVFRHGKRTPLEG
jgi:hypothetical protein